MSHQMLDWKDQHSVLNNEIEALKAVIKKKSKASEEMEEYLKEYEENLKELEQELKTKDEIIEDLKKSDITRLEHLNLKYHDGNSLFTDSEGRSEEYDKYSDRTLEHDFGRLTVRNDYMLKGRMTDVINKNLIENEELRARLNRSSKRVSQIFEKSEDQKLRIENLEQDLKTLQAHYSALEKEMFISDKKLKNAQFKNEGLVKDIALYRKSFDEMEAAYEKMERKCIKLEEMLRETQMTIKNQELLKEDRIFMNPTLNLTRFSTNLYGLYSSNNYIEVDILPKELENTVINHIIK